MKKQVWVQKAPGSRHVPTDALECLYGSALKHAEEAWCTCIQSADFCRCGPDTQRKLTTVETPGVHITGETIRLRGGEEYTATLKELQTGEGYKETLR